jgi:hypothetical protein
VQQAANIEIARVTIVCLSASSIRPAARRQSAFSIINRAEASSFIGKMLSRFRGDSGPPCPRLVPRLPYKLAMIALVVWKPAETSDVRAKMALVRTLLCDAHHSAAD